VKPPKNFYGIFCFGKIFQKFSFPTFESNPRKNLRKKFVLSPREVFISGGRLELKEVCINREFERTINRHSVSNGHDMPG
jgi:hypothetical protein